MNKFSMRYTPEASRLLSRFHPRPPRLSESDGGQAENKKLIKQALVDLRENPYAGRDLQEELYGYKSFKLKRYRVLYNINEEENTIQIFHIGHRKDVYEQLNRLLNQLKKPS
jgi:mRNA interferase RelE/StbE